MINNNQQIEELKKRIETSTTSEELTTILQEVNNISSEQDKALAVLALIKNDNADSSIYNAIYKTVQSFKNVDRQIYILYALLPKVSESLQNNVFEMIKEQPLNKHDKADVLEFFIQSLPGQIQISISMMQNFLDYFKDDDKLLERIRTAIANQLSTTKSPLEVECSNFAEFMRQNGLGLGSQGMNM